MHTVPQTVCLNIVTTCMVFHRLEHWVSSQFAAYRKQIYNLLDCELHIGREWGVESESRGFGRLPNGLN
jgi:hypothetical protein